MLKMVIDGFTRYQLQTEFEQKTLLFLNFKWHLQLKVRLVIISQLI